jgi:RNA recognition motif-containing protein
MIYAPHSANEQWNCSMEKMLTGEGIQGHAMKLYVGNLGFTITDAQLEFLFAQYGTVDSAKVMRNEATGHGRGFGLVEMSDPDARQAMQLLNGKDVEGRSLTVNEARSTSQECKDKRI